MKAIVTVGLGFGDEGKGAAVDSLCRSLGADLVVRYCGGGQAGHNVFLADGRSHTFSQFGAGAFAGARTYLGPRMIVSPSTLGPEADHLRQLGISNPCDTLTAHPDCLIATLYHSAMNRLREHARGDRRHGSCGLGIGETRSYWLKHGLDAVVASDLNDPALLVSKLRLLRDRMLLEMQELKRLDPEYAQLLHAISAEQEADQLRWATEPLSLSAVMPTSELAVFEGAQGVLLDEWKGFHPHTTWSTVTPQHALEMLDDVDRDDIVVLGITRAYTTRHGAGPFPTACPEMSAAMIDRSNPHNDWQGSMRFGPLDLVLAEYAARVSAVDGIVVSGLDQLEAQTRVATRYRGLTRLCEPVCLNEQQELTARLMAAEPVFELCAADRICDHLAAIAPVLGTAHGPGHQHRQWHGITDLLSSHAHRRWDAGKRQDLGFPTCTRAVS